jgi:NAD(P)-dependent dehydrogenase (short-subunit alcohol dehydrogenase family)
MSPFCSIHPKPFSAIICTAGGWAGGSIAAPTVELARAVDGMYSSSFVSALTASHVAASQLAPKGTLIIVGSAAALDPTPSMIAYGCMKAAAHHLILSLAVSGSGLPEGAHVLGVLPHTIDTPANREGMGTKNLSSWTPAEEIANKMFEWCARVGGLPQNGALVEVRTKDSKSTWCAV